MSIASAPHFPHCWPIRNSARTSGVMPAELSCNPHPGTSGQAARADLPRVPGVRRRLTITTEIIAPYRIPVFNALAEHPEIDLHIIFLAETDPTQRQWLVYKNEVKFSYEVLPSWRRRMRKQNLLVNWGVTAALHRAAPEVIVCG